VSQTFYSQGISQSLGWDSDADPPAEIWPFLSDYARNQQYNFARWRFWFDRHIIRAYVLGRMAGQNGLQNAAERGINDEDFEEHQGGPFNPQVHRNHPNLDKPPTPANGLTLRRQAAHEVLMGRMSDILLHVPPMLFKRRGERLMKTLDHFRIMSLPARQRRRSSPFCKKSAKPFAESFGIRTACFAQKL
jgi:hypothetical protein